MRIKIIALLFLLLLSDTCLYSMILSSEIRVNEKEFIIKDYSFINNMQISSIVSKKDKNFSIVWLKMEASSLESLEQICQFDKGEIIELSFSNFKNKIKTCFSNKKDIGFKIEAYKNVKFANIHRFQFPPGINIKEIREFFSRVSYLPEAARK